jgi:L-rhamnose mutarotase
MASGWELLADAIVADLQANVTGLDTTTIPAANVHKLVPWDEATMFAMQSDRHLAVWPTVEAAEASAGLTTNSVFLSQAWQVLVWEDLHSAAAMGASTAVYAGWQAFFSLQEATRARLLHYKNQGGKPLAGREYTYRGTRLSGPLANARWFSAELLIQIPADY